MPYAGKAESNTGDSIFGKKSFDDRGHISQLSCFLVSYAGKAESTGDSGSVLQQLSYRKAAMFALAKQAEASSAAASRSEKELKHSMARIKELKSQVGKASPWPFSEQYDPAHTNDISAC